MTYKVFNSLIRDALEAENEEMFVAERGWQEWMDECEDDTDAIVSDMQNIWDLAHLTIKEMRQRTGWTQAKFAERFGIPLKTLESWESGGSASSRKCSIYQKLCLAEVLGMITVKRDFE